MSSPSPNGHSFDWEGQTYFLPAITAADKSTYHAIANAYALSMVRAMAPYQTFEENQEDRAEAMRLVTAGYYWWDEHGGWSFRGTKEGFIRLCYLCLQHKHKKLKVEDVRRMGDVDGGAWLAEQYRLANPNPTPSPAAGTSPIPSDNPSSAATSGSSSTPDSLKTGDSASAKSAA